MTPSDGLINYGQEFSSGELLRGPSRAVLLPFCRPSPSAVLADRAASWSLPQFLRRSRQPCRVIWAVSTHATLARRKDGVRRLGLRWERNLRAPVIQGNTLTYKDVVPGGDLVLHVTAPGFWHAIVVSLQTGNFSVSATDAVMTAWGSHLSISCSFNSQDPGLAVTDGQKITGPGGIRRSPLNSVSIVMPGTPCSEPRARHGPRSRTCFTWTNNAESAFRPCGHAFESDLRTEPLSQGPGRVEADSIRRDVQETSKNA